MDIRPHLHIYLFHTLFEGRDLINTLHFFFDKTFLTFLWLSPLAEEDSAEEEDCSYLQKRRCNRYLFIFVCLFLPFFFLHFLRCLFLVRKEMRSFKLLKHGFFLKIWRNPCPFSSVTWRHVASCSCQAVFWAAYL